MHWLAGAHANQRRRRRLSISIVTIVFQSPLMNRTNVISNPQRRMIQTEALWRQRVMRDV